MSVLLLSFRGVIMNLSRGRHSAVVYVKWTQWWVLLLSFRGVIRNFSRGRGVFSFNLELNTPLGTIMLTYEGGKAPFLYTPLLRCRNKSKSGRIKHQTKHKPLAHAKTQTHQNFRIKNCKLILQNFAKYQFIKILTFFTGVLSTSIFITNLRRNYKF